jgi:hypothetical protein
MGNEINSPKAEPEELIAESGRVIKKSNKQRLGLRTPKTWIANTQDLDCEHPDADQNQRAGDDIQKAARGESKNSRKNEEALSRS